MEKRAAEILKKTTLLQQIELEEAMYLYYNAPIADLMQAANTIRNKINPGRGVSWQIDRNVNYTNICISRCLFCNFHCPPHRVEKGYSLTIDDYKTKIAELLEKGGNQLLLQGGLHPKYDITYYEELFSSIKKIAPSIKLNALGPPEIAHISRLSSLSYKETLDRLIRSGLDTLPGAGAEILSDRVRKIISPAKPSAKEWIDVMKEAHKLNISTTATMVYGSIETAQERIEHLFTIRNIQNNKPNNSVGFRAFIAWPMQLEGTKLKKLIDMGTLRVENTNSGGAEYIRIIALSRIILLNIKHIQASWLTVGIPTAQIALHSGADDMGSIMIEENVVSSAGGKNKLDRDGMEEAIRRGGFHPWLRDQQYRTL